MSHLLTCIIHAGEKPHLLTCHCIHNTCRSNVTFTDLPLHTLHVGVMPHLMTCHCIHNAVGVMPHLMTCHCIHNACRSNATFNYSIHIMPELITCKDGTDRLLDINQ